MNTYAEIAVSLPIEGAFTYSIPVGLKDEAHLGKRVLVPFGRRTVTGYILGLTDKATEGVAEIKDIIDILDEIPLFDEKRLKFLKWVSSYYFAPIGEVLALTHPAHTSVKSLRMLKATEGAERSGRSTVEKEIIKRCEKWAPISALTSKIKGPVYSAIERLKRQGLLIEEVRLKGGGAEKTESFVNATGSKDAIDLKKSPVQAKVFKYLCGLGSEISLKELKRQFGEVSAAVKKLEEKKLVKITERQVARDPFSEIAPKSYDYEPNAEQRRAIEEICSAIRGGSYSPFLLYGVTGSGKTLVYLNALEEAVRLGKKAIILSPEINLTTWPAAYLIEKFPGRVALVHSGLSEGERYDQWMRILKGEADIVVGARSALLSPVKDLGLIIVDEEHETSYKQEDGVKYSARDSALALGKTLGITVVLGSATPSVETFYNATTGKLKPLVLEKRAANSTLPEIELEDMKGKKNEVISKRLREMLEKNLVNGHQALLFLNRRGFSNFIICRDCGEAISCVNCSVSLTLHKKSKSLKCHYCGLSAPVPAQCPKCKSPNIDAPGTGTERVEEEIRALLPKARVGRMDRDTTAKKGSAKKIIEAVEGRQVDILVGTQMVSKGHHFPGIALVGVISGDVSLNIPDFRSSERTFQLITQAAGRAGRGEIAGEVVIQTLNPGHYSFSCAIKHDYDSFYEEEIKTREEAAYPPFTRLCGLRIEGVKEEKVLEACSILKAAADRYSDKTQITVLGPAPSVIGRVDNRYRYQMLVKGAPQELNRMHTLVKTLKAAFDAHAPSGVSLIIDMDPVNTF